MIGPLGLLLILLANVLLIVMVGLGFWYQIGVNQRVDQRLWDVEQALRMRSPGEKGVEQ